MKNILGGCFFRKPAYPVIKMDDQSNQPTIRLRPANIDEDCSHALLWYQDPEVLHFSEGPGTEAYDPETVQAMYRYLASIGRLYIIEAQEDGEWVPIGDVTLSRETIPIVIGDPGYRSRGIGTRVIRMLIEMAREEQWTELKVKKVYTFNDRSHRMFTGLGFAVTGEGVDENGHRYRSYRLEL